MEVHAHAHTARKKWTHYFWEFLMLFLAVFCGFLAENQREHYIEKVRAKQYAKSLVNDLTEDTTMIKRIIRQAKYESNRTNRLSDYLRNKPIEQIKNIDLYVTSIEIYRPYTWNRTTLEQIKNSGSIRYFTNDSIVYRLSAYDALARHMDEDYAGDQERLNKVIDLRNQVCNQNYPFEFREIVSSTRYRPLDSLMKTGTYIEMGKNGPGLLTRNIHDIEAYTNEIIGLGERLRTRSEEELPELLQEAKKLIFLLKNEYHLK